MGDGIEWNMLRFLTLPDFVPRNSFAGPPWEFFRWGVSSSTGLTLHSALTASSPPLSQNGLQKDWGGVLFPLIAYSHCPSATREYPGTVSVRTETMIEYLTEVFRGILATDVKGILVLNAHDGNIEVVKAAGEVISDEFPDRFVLLINWWQTLPESFVNSLGFFSQSGGHGHGGPLETSVVQAIKPEAVELIKGKDIDLKPGSANEVIHVVSEENRRDVWAGYHGRVSEASKEKGEVLIEESVKRIIRAVQEWMKSGV
ncbi:hypothetical protein ES703_55381 [subsurface metagenome]